MGEKLIFGGIFQEILIVCEENIPASNLYALTVLNRQAVSYEAKATVNYPSVGQERLIVVADYKCRQIWLNKKGDKYEL